MDPEFSNPNTSSDAIMPLEIVAGVAAQVDLKRDMEKHFRAAHWDNNQFLKWVLQIERETQARPIWSLRKVKLDPVIVIIEEQWTEVRRAADEVYHTFHQKCKELAENEKVKQITTQGKYNICDLAWREIVKLTHVVAQILKKESICNLDIGLCEFGQKRLEMWKLACHWYMLGAHCRMRKEALKNFEPILHALLLEAAAEGEAERIGGKTEKVLPPGAVSGADANMAMSQQRPAHDQSLYMFAAKMHLASVAELLFTPQELV